MCTVSDIFDKLNKTFDTSLPIVSRISKVHVMRLVTH